MHQQRRKDCDTHLCSLRLCEARLHVGQRLVGETGKGKAERRERRIRQVRGSLGKRSQACEDRYCHMPRIAARVTEASVALARAATE